MKHTRLLSLALSAALLLTGCGASAASASSASAETDAADAKTVAVLYTNDVHCAIDENLGYQGIALAEQTLAAAGMEVLLADAGDSIQGGPVGTLSDGEYIIELMNDLGYDIATPGNHEFDYTVPQLLTLTEEADFPYVSCNFLDKDGSRVLDAYKIIEAGGHKIAFIGISTPYTLTTSTPAFFEDENGNALYSFGQDDTGETVYGLVQEAADAAAAEGADVVVALAHLGIDAECAPWTSSDVIENTSGIDVVLDGHSHSVLEQEVVKNKNGEPVLLSSTGTKLANIGCLLIAPDGSVSTTLLNDGGISEDVAEIEDSYSELLETVVARSDADLCITDPKTGERMVRSNETNLADLCADAYRYVTGADAAIINGGGVRADVSAGDITYGDLLSVQPFGNSICMIEVTGQQLMDALEFGACALPAENGGFLQVSGITYTVDVSVASTVTKDANGMFTGVTGARRVSNVCIGGEPVDPEKTYTLAGTDYTLRENGDGYTCFDGCALLLDEVALDNQALIDYITDELGGTAGDAYADPYGQGRIEIIGG